MDKARAKRWAIRVTAALGGLLLFAVLAVGALFVWLGTDSARRAVLGFAQSALAEQGLFLEARETSGHLPFRLDLDGVSLADADGVWLSLDKAHLSLSPFKLLGLTAQVDSLRLEGLSILRLPHLPPGPQVEETARPREYLNPGSISMPIDIRVNEMALLGARVEVGLLAEIMPGQKDGFLRLGAVDINIEASAEMLRGAMMKPGNITAEVKANINLASGRLFDLALFSGPGNGLPDRLHLEFALREGRGGLLASFTGLDELPPYSVKVSSDSSLRDLHLNFDASAERLAAVSGRISLVPVKTGNGRKDSLEHFLSPNWRAEMHIKAEPGPMLSENGGAFAVLPPEALEFIGNAVDLSLFMSSKVGGNAGEASELRVDSLRLGNRLLELGLDSAVLRISGGGPKLDFDGTILAKITDEKFFRLLGVEDGAVPLFGKSELQLAAQASADLGGENFSADFSLKGPLTVESRYELFCGEAPAVLSADLELGGNFDGALMLDVLRLSSLGLDIDGNAGLVPSPLAISLEANVSGDRRGEWNNVLHRLSGGVPATGFKAKLAANLSQKQAEAELELAAKISLAASEFEWPAKELERALGTYAAVLVEFSGPVMSPYSIKLNGFTTGFEPVEAGDYVPETIMEPHVSARGRGNIEISIPGVAPSAWMSGHGNEAQTSLVTLNGRVDASLGNVGLFLADTGDIVGPALVSALISGLAGGGETTTLHMEARLDNLGGALVTSPLGDVVLSAETAMDLTVRKETALAGTALLNVQSSKAGPIHLDSGWSVNIPEAAGVKLAVKDMVFSFAGLSLTGGAEAWLPTGEGADKPVLGGKIEAHFENWNGLNDIFKSLELNIPAVTGTPLHLTVEMGHEGAGVQNATLHFDFERLHMLMNSETPAAALPATGKKQPPLGTPGMILLNGIQARVSLADFWGKRLMSAHAKTDSGSMDVESWKSFAIYLDLAGNTGRINMSMRGDGEALSHVQAFDAGAPLFTPEMAEQYLRESGSNGTAQRRRPASVGLDEKQAARAEAGLADIEMGTLAGIFRLNPFAIRLERAAVYAPELATGMYLQSPAFISVDGDVIIRGVDFSVLPDGFFRVDAHFSSKESRANVDIQDLSLALIRKLSGIPLPDGELSLASTMSMKDGEFGGATEISAALRPAAVQIKRDATPQDMLLKMKGTLSKESGEFKLPTGPGLVRLVGSGNLGAAESGGKSDLQLAFDVPFYSNEHGMLMPDAKALLAATLSWRGELGRVWAVLPIADRHLNGMGQLDFRVGGTLSRLEYTGKAYLAGARYEDRVAGFMLEDLNLEAFATPQGSKLVLAAKDGREGSLTLEARLDDTGAIDTGFGGGAAPSLPELTARGQLNHLAPLYRDDLYLRLSGIFDVSGSLLAPMVQGKFEIEQGNLNLLANLGGAVATLPVEERSKTEVEKIPRQSPLLDITVEAPRRFYVRGPGLDSEWQVSATVKGQVANPEFSAVISPVRGYFDLLSRPFAFTKGQVMVWGNNDYFDSSLDLLLTYTSTSLTAEVNTGGSIKRPTLALTSTPVMPQDQILAQVIFGKDIAQLSAIEALQVANGVRQLTLFGQGGFDLMGDVRSLLGVDTLRIGSSGSGLNSSNISGSPDASVFGVGDGADAQAETTPTVEAGKYINDSIYVGVEQGTVENSTRVRVEIELKPNLTLEGSGGGDSSQVGLGWKLDY